MGIYGVSYVSLKPAQCSTVFFMQNRVILGRDISKVDGD